MGQSEDIIQQACSLEDMEPVVEWFSLQNFEKSFYNTSLERECRQQNPTAAEAEV